MSAPMLRSNHNLVFQCAFHVVWSPKYRRSVLVPPVDERLKMILVEVIRERVLCGHHRRRTAGGHRALRREPEARLMLVGRRYRLELDAEQTAYAERVASICRAVWNAALDQRRIAAQLNRGRTADRAVWPSFVSQCRELAEAKQTEPWLAEAPAHCLQQTLRDLDTACRAHGAWGVHFRARYRWAPSF